MSMFSSDKLRAAIERCNKECEAAISRHDKPERIECMRQGIETLHRWLERAERDEREASRTGI